MRLKNPREARRQGISIVFQELNLFPHRTVAANVFANRELIESLGLGPPPGDARGHPARALRVGRPPLARRARRRRSPSAKSNWSRSPARSNSSRGSSSSTNPTRP